MWTKSLLLIVLVFSAVLVVNPAEGEDGVPYQSERWNDKDPLGLGSGVWEPPAGGESLWAYWDENFEPYPADGAGYNYHHKPMHWSAKGGVKESGYVWVPLSDVMSEHNEIQAFWPAYMTDQQTEYYHHHYPEKSPHPRHLDLTVDNAHIKVSLLDRGQLSQPVNLAGGKIYFFVGEWWSNDLQDPNDDAFIFFYNSNGAFNVTGNDWTTTSVPVGNGSALAGDWKIIASSAGLDGYENPPEDGDEAVDHFYSPQQWGFTIFNGTATVRPVISGELGFDDFAIVPEPGTLTLLTLALITLGLFSWRRRR